MPAQACVMRPSRVTCVASTISSPAPLWASWPRWMRCQSFMQPSSAWYWHMGETTTRLGSVMPPSWIGVKSFAGMCRILGCGDADAALAERFAQRAREGDGARLVPVDAERLGGDRHALAGEARNVALLDHRERLRHRLFGVGDHAARLIARRERAIVGVATIGKHFAADGDAGG